MVMEEEDVYVVWIFCLGFRWFLVCSIFEISCTVPINRSAAVSLCQEQQRKQNARHGVPSPYGGACFYLLTFNFKVESEGEVDLGA